jgi:hypothetical protein
MTFYVRTDEPAFSKAFKTELEDRGFKEATKFPANIVFLSGESAYYKNKKDLKKSDLVNCIHPVKITNKLELSELFKDSDFIMNFDIIRNKIPILPSQFLKILKPLGGYQGKGISIVTNSTEVEEWIEKHDYSEWLLQDYVVDPALKNGHKFHLRVPILVVKNTVFVCNKSPYYIAKSPYEQSDWKNPEIHDTHYSGNKYFYPEDLPDGWKRQTNIMKMLEKVFEVSLKVAWNGKLPYYLFGADVMFDGRQPILLEVNEKIGLKEMDFVIPGMISILFGKDHPDFTRL